MILCSSGRRRTGSADDADTGHGDSGLWRGLTSIHQFPLYVVVGTAHIRSRPNGAESALAAAEKAAERSPRPPLASPRRRVVRSCGDGRSARDADRLGHLSGGRAHPDDMEYGASGAVARWTGAGKTVDYLMVTEARPASTAWTPAEVGLPSASPNSAPRARRSASRRSSFSTSPTARSSTARHCGGRHRRGDPPAVRAGRHRQPSRHLPGRRVQHGRPPGHRAGPCGCRPRRRQPLGVHRPRRRRREPWGGVRWVANRRAAGDARRRLTGSFDAAFAAGGPPPLPPSLGGNPMADAAGFLRRWPNRPPPASAAA